MATPYCPGWGNKNFEPSAAAGEEFVRDLEQYARPVAGAFVGPGRPAVHEVQKHLLSVLDNIVIAASGYVDYRADAAGVVLELGVV